MNQIPLTLTHPKPQQAEPATLHCRPQVTWRQRLLVFCLACSVFQPVATTLAHEDHDLPAKVADDKAYEPSAIPDRILLTWTNDPSVSQAVTWRTDVATPHGVAEIAVADDGPRFVDYRVPVKATTTRFESNLGEANYHVVEFKNLRPKTLYAYRVGDGTNWSAWNHFRTASQDREPFTFVYFGDAQNDLKSHWSRVVREAFRDAPRAGFFLHAGDLVNRANNDAEWGEWHGAGSFINQTIPSIATPGNHEYYKTEEVDEDGDNVRKLSEQWRPTLTLPLNGPEGLEETVYWLDYQGVRVISLNSNEQQDKQVPWLENVLANNPNRWTVITFHHPIYSTKTGRDNPELRQLWQPLFDKYQVDLVLQGHDHTYGRTKLMTSSDNVPEGVRQRRPESGTVYVVSVSGPKMYDLGRRPFMRRAAEDVQLYQIIHVDGQQLRYEARTATGRLYDAFSLIKQDGKPNRLVDEIPESRERRRVD